MKICRYDDDRLGVVDGDRVIDVSEALRLLPPQRWPIPPGDLLIASLDQLKPELERLARRGMPRPVASVTLRSPVANPTKLIAAPLNYRLHIEESKIDAGIHHGVHQTTHDGFATPVDKFGLFLKATSALVGAGDGVAIQFPDRRNDHEIELAVVIGRTCRHVSQAEARGVIAGYAIGFDMTVRGPQDRSFRKSADGYAVLGPWLVTADEIADPGRLAFTLTIGNTLRQKGNTADLLMSIERQIEFASSCYTLHPGDVIFTGTPEGVDSVKPGDRMVAWMEGIGMMEVAVR
jgi:2-keto-4-pentenoate hydratase/2-oxohepta-3-ene-1,7-dioic acid hydratase in catechol pathway